MEYTGGTVLTDVGRWSIIVDHLGTMSFSCLTDIGDATQTGTPAIQFTRSGTIPALCILSCGFQITAPAGSGDNANMLLTSGGGTGVPIIGMTNPVAPANQQLWNQYVDSSGTWRLDADSGTTGVFTNAITFTRSGSTPLTMNVNGTFTAATKNFALPHPLEPERTLVHSSLEGPEIAVFYRGEGRLVDGKAVVALPEYFEALTRLESSTVLLTPIFNSDDEPISCLAASRIVNGKFSVRAMDKANPQQEFCWEVKAVRADQPPLQVVQ
jgi:hypothetical protein